MDLRLFYIDTWRALTRAEKETAAHKLLTVLPEGWQFHDIAVCSLGGQTNEIALFQWDGVPFALVPGNEAAVLGFDPLNEEALRQIHLKYCEQEREIFGNDEDEDEDGYTPMEGCPDPTELVQTLIEDCLTPLRTVSIKPFLCECFPKAMYEAFGPIGAKFWTTPIEIQEHLQSGDFRLLTSDEWEYACAAGTRTIFRWGNDVNDAPFSPEYVDPDSHEWKLAALPNAFGLFMPFDSYMREVVTETGITRGGDGGVAVSNGDPGAPVWITLASAYIEIEQMPEMSFISSDTRRAFTIPQII